MDESTLATAMLLQEEGWSLESCASSEDSDWEEHGDLIDYLVLHRCKRSINTKPRGRDSQVWRWLTDSFWWKDPEFKHNLLESHSTFLRIVQWLVAPTV